MSRCLEVSSMCTENFMWTKNDMFTLGGQKLREHGQSFWSEQRSVRSVRKIHHKDNGLLAAARRSSDANFRQSADCRKLGSLEPHKNHTETVVRNFFLEAVLCFSEVFFFKFSVTFVWVGKNLSNLSQKLLFRLFHNLGFLLLRTCLLACSPPLLVPCSLPLSYVILSTEKFWANMSRW